MPLPTRPSLTRRELLAALPCGLFLAPARAATQGAWAILRQCEANYRKALSYDVSLSFWSRPDGLAPGLATMPTHRATARLAAVAPDLFYSEWRSNAPTRKSGATSDASILCCDGRSVFQFRHNLNEYKEEVYRHTPDSAPRQTEGAKLFARSHEEHFERFHSVATRPQREPRFRGEKTIKVLGRKVSCLQIDTRSIAPGGHRWREQLWFDPNNHRIIQSLRERMQLTGDRKFRYLLLSQSQYDWHVLGGELPPETFRFVPPEGAKFVERFSWKPFGPIQQR